MSPRPWRSSPRTRSGPLADIFSCHYHYNHSYPGDNWSGFNKLVTVSATGLKTIQSPPVRLEHIHAAEQCGLALLPVHCNVQCAFPMFGLQENFLREFSIQSVNPKCLLPACGNQLLCSASQTISHYDRRFHFRNYTEYLVLYYLNISLTNCIV